MLTGAHTVSAATRKSLPYDPIKDFAFISTVTSFPFVIAVRAEHPAKTLAQLIELSKKGENRVSFTSVGVGSTQHLVGELLGGRGRAIAPHSLSRGRRARCSQSLRARLTCSLTYTHFAIPHIQSGRLRALAVTSAAPWPSLPGVPPAASRSRASRCSPGWAMAAPAATPAAIVRRLNSQGHKVLQDADCGKPGVVRQCGQRTARPKRCGKSIQADIARWRGVIARRGIQIQS